MKESWIVVFAPFTFGNFKRFISLYIHTWIRIFRDRYGKCLLCCSRDNYPASDGYGKCALLSTPVDSIIRCDCVFATNNMRTIMLFSDYRTFTNAGIILVSKSLVKNNLKLLSGVIFSVANGRQALICYSILRVCLRPIADFSKLEESVLLTLVILCWISVY